MRIGTFLRPTVLCCLSASAGACSSPSLAYKPDMQPKGATLSADYRLLQDRLDVAVETDGRRLEDAYLVLPGSVLRPSSVSDPVFDRDRIGLGVGIPFTPVGVGLGPGIPVGDEKARGETHAYFPADAAGPGPWRLHVKVAGTAPVDITLPQPASDPPGSVALGRTAD